MVVSYYQGLSESVKKTCNKHGVQVYFRGGVTIMNLLMAPKDWDPMLKTMGSSTDKNVIEWNVMRNILKSPSEHLEKVQRTPEGPILHL